MIFLGVLITALITVPVSVKIHDQNLALAQAERVEIAAMTSNEAANDWCDPAADE
jgi:CBS-domain-containing membrane protein